MKTRFEYEFSVNLPEFSGVISCQKDVNYDSLDDIPVLYEKNKVIAMNDFMENWEIKND